MENYRLDHLVADVLAVADELNGHQIDVVGHGWGAAAVCARHRAYRFEVLAGVSHWIPEAAPDQLSHLLLDHLRSVASA
ncbi:MAG TPA: hypothetical protein VMZ51_02635 [Acidimicrobiales bacterium]|nr:hypothetical protein [Acidimicrobiales bacterium]